MHSLPLFHRVAGQPVILVGEGEAAEAKRRLIERAGGRVVGFDDIAARLAFVALGTPEPVVADLRARGILVNVVDRPDLCDFTMPSLLERGPVLVAVGTGGASAGLAKALRLRLEALLPSNLGRLAEGLQSVRELLRQRFPDPTERRLALDQALTDGGVLDPLRDGSANAVADWLDGAASAPVTVNEFVFAGYSPDDLTLRQARWLGSADVILHEDRIPEAVLNRARADAVRRVIATNEAPLQISGTTVIIRRG